MTSPRIIPETDVYDGSNGSVSVNSGSLVTLLSAEEMVKLGVSEDKYFAQKNVDFLRNNMLDGSEGPHSVDSIGQWPCGKVMFYLKLSNGRKPGVYASDFKISE